MHKYLGCSLVCAWILQHLIRMNKYMLNSKICFLCFSVGWEKTSDIDMSRHVSIYRDVSIYRHVSACLDKSTCLDTYMWYIYIYIHIYIYIYEWCSLAGVGRNRENWRAIASAIRRASAVCPPVRPPPSIRLPSAEWSCQKNSNAQVDTTLCLQDCVCPDFN